METHESNVERRVTSTTKKLWYSNGKHMGVWYIYQSTAGIPVHMLGIYMIITWYFLLMAPTIHLIFACFQECQPRKQTCKEFITITESKATGFFVLFVVNSVSPPRFLCVLDPRDSARSRPTHPPMIVKQTQATCQDSTYIHSCFIIIWIAKRKPVLKLK